MQIIEATNRPSFDIFTQEQLDTLEKACQTVDFRTYIAKVDYNTGKIYIGHHYDSFDDDSFMEINVASDSVAAAFYDVYTRVYERCI